jgi:glycosyl transferase family 25
MTLVEYFDRTCIINLPERTDRLRQIRGEVPRCGGDDHPEKVQIPPAPKPADAYGFASRGVYGSYLSHLNILEDALRDGLETVWILEDDAIFSARMVREQAQVVEFLRQNPWDMCFLGHTLRRELYGKPRGLIRYSNVFRWSHCYVVHARILPSLIAYLKENMDNPEGHPRGGKLYIDAAYIYFRQLINPETVSLVANPVMAVQRGSVSSLAGGHWYDRSRWLVPPAGLARSLRDELWRWTDLHLSPAPPNFSNDPRIQA